MKSNRYKSLILFFLVLMIFAGLTCVCAQDINDTDTSGSDGNIILDDIDDEILSADNDEILADVGTFSELQNIIDNAEIGSTVILDKNYTSSGEALHISDITLDGKNHYLDGNKSSRILNLGHNVTIKNINFINGACFDDNGGAVYISSSNCRIENCNFINNYAADSGGAVYVIYNKVVFHNCNFTENNAYHGGAVYFSGENSIMTNCNFVNNSVGINKYVVRKDPEGHAFAYGGAVYFEGSNGTISDCFFTQNSATNGGAVYWTGQDGTITDCIFTRNSATGAGGAVVLGLTDFQKLNGNILNCIFTHNSAADGSDSAVFSKGMTNNVINCNFTGNGLSCYGTTHVFGCNFVENTDYSIFWKSEGDINCCTFTKNNGPIICGDSKGIITNCTFTNNSNSYYGGGIYYDIGVSGVVTNCTFTGNTAKDGGAIAYWYNAKCTVTNCKFSDNTPNNVQKVRFATTIQTFKTTAEYDFNAKFNLWIIDEWDYDVNGKFTVKINGKSQVISTKNRVLNLKGLAPKTYNAIVIYNGDTKHAPSKATFKVVITKADPYLVVKSKTFAKSVKVKKYQIKLRDYFKKPLKNQKVTLKVNKKVYVAKTNAKGVATFKITKLTKKGTFNALILYKGNKYYNLRWDVVKFKVK